jgi:hypothetical protein
MLRKTCDSLACDNPVEKSVWNLWKFTLSSEIVKHHLSQIFWSTLWMRSSLTTDGWLTTLLYMNICSPIHLWTFYTSVLQFLHSLHSGCKLLCIIHNGFLQWITGYIITHSVGDKNKH